MVKPLLVIACGALAREINHLRKTCGWQHMDLKCIDAKLHNRPALIPNAIRQRIQRYREEYEQIFVAYADCGTGGAIDRLLEEEGIERLPGAHCYQFFAGEQEFLQLAEKELGTFYLTDFLARNFQSLVVRALKLDLHPELMPLYFKHYKKLVYLAQTTNPDLQQAAKEAADYLGLDYQCIKTGYGELQSSLHTAVIQRDLHQQPTSAPSQRFTERRADEKNSHLLA